MNDFISTDNTIITRNQSLIASVVQIYEPVTLKIAGILKPQRSKYSTSGFGAIRVQEFSLEAVRTAKAGRFNCFITERDHIKAIDSDFTAELFSYNAEFDHCDEKDLISPENVLQQTLKDFFITWDIIAYSSYAKNLNSFTPLLTEALTIDALNSAIVKGAQTIRKELGFTTFTGVYLVINPAIEAFLAQSVGGGFQTNLGLIQPILNLYNLTLVVLPDDINTFLLSKTGDTKYITTGMGADDGLMFMTYIDNNELFHGFFPQIRKIVRNEVDELTNYKLGYHDAVINNRGNLKNSVFKRFTAV